MRPIDVTDFLSVDPTAFIRWALAEVRAFARGLSSSGIAADARAIGKAGERLADSIAELERDVDALRPRWKGEAAAGSFDAIGGYAARSYRSGASVDQLVGRVQSLSSAAADTNSRFAELADPVTPMGVGPSPFDRFDPRPVIAAALKTSYTDPVAGAASTMPLSEGTGSVSFAGVGVDRLLPMAEQASPGVGVPELSPGGSDADSAGAGATAGTGPVDGEDGAGDTGASGRAPADPQLGGDGRASTAPLGGGTVAPATMGGTAPAAAMLSPAPGDSATGFSGRAREDHGSGPDSGPDGADPFGAPVGASLLSPAASVPSSPSSRGAGGGIGGVRGGELAKSASPLGIRQDPSPMRTSGPGSTPGGPAGGGARPAASPYGMPPAGAGGQRGQGESRHRVPAYLIDKRNGEEVIGPMPLVGPGVIGQWRSDGSPENRPERPADPPVRGGRRPR